jgi:hypothetical protein
MPIFIEGSGKWIINTVTVLLAHCFLTAIETSTIYICFLLLQERPL